MIDSKNIHYYLKDPNTGIIYRTIGYTYPDELIVYPKYLPSFTGARGESMIKYQGINYPGGAVRYLATTRLSDNSVVDIRLNHTFHTFLPMADKNKVSLYDPLIVLKERLAENIPRSSLMKELILLLSEISKVGLDSFGLDASMLVHMDKEGSDIDVVVYDKDNAQKIRSAWEGISAVNEYNLTKPSDKNEAIVSRRKAYSPLMTEEEIITWEERKISGYFKGIKFSVMPVDSDAKYSCEYISTGQFVAIRVTLKSDEILCDPGVLNLKEHSVDVIYGPKNININQFITFLPSRMGIFLKKDDSIFILGKAYAESVNGSDSGFALTQFPWDDRSYFGESHYVAKIEKVNLQHMIPALLGLEFNSNYITD